MPVGRLAHHLDVGFGAEDHAEPRAQQALVVREQDADHGPETSGSRTRNA